MRNYIPNCIDVGDVLRSSSPSRNMLKLAEYYAKDLLTPVYVPDETDEEVETLWQVERSDSKTASANKC